MIGEDRGAWSIWREDALPRQLDSARGACEHRRLRDRYRALGLLGKASGQPLWRLFGGYSSRVRTYQSGWRSEELDVLQRQAADLVAQATRPSRCALTRSATDGWKQCGARARRARGDRLRRRPDVRRQPELDAIAGHRVGRALEEFELFWIEDPTLMTTSTTGVHCRCPRRANLRRGVPLQT